MSWAWNWNAGGNASTMSLADHNVLLQTRNSRSASSTTCESRNKSPTKLIRRCRDDPDPSYSGAGAGTVGAADAVARTPHRKRVLMKRNTTENFDFISAEYQSMLLKVQSFSWSAFSKPAITCEHTFTEYCETLDLKWNVSFKSKSENKRRCHKYVIEVFHGSFYWQEIEGKYLLQPEQAREHAFATACITVITNFGWAIKFGSGLDTNSCPIESHTDTAQVESNCQQKADCNPWYSRCDPWDYSWAAYLVSPIQPFMFPSENGYQFPPHPTSLLHNLLPPLPSEPNLSPIKPPLPPEPYISPTKPPLPPGPFISPIKPPLPPEPYISPIKPPLPPEPYISPIKPPLPPEPFISSIKPPLPPEPFISPIKPPLPPEPFISPIKPPLPPEPYIFPTIPPPPGEPYASPLNPPPPGETYASPLNLPPGEPYTSRLNPPPPGEPYASPPLNPPPPGETHSPFNPPPPGEPYASPPLNPTPPGESYASPFNPPPPGETYGSPLNPPPPGEPYLSPVILPQPGEPYLSPVKLPPPGEPYLSPGKLPPPFEPNVPSTKIQSLTSTSLLDTTLCLPLKPFLPAKMLPHSPPFLKQFEYSLNQSTAPPSIVTPVSKPVQQSSPRIVLAVKDLAPKQPFKCRRKLFSSLLLTPKIVLLKKEYDPKRFALDGGDLNSDNVETLTNLTSNKSSNDITAVEIPASQIIS